MALVLAQIYLGALVAGLDAGMSFNTWPLIDGAFIPASERLWFETPWWRKGVSVPSLPDVPPAEQSLDSLVPSLDDVLVVSPVTGALSSTVPSPVPADASAAATAADGVSINGDLYASESYRTHLAIVYTRRAIAAAAAKAK